MVAQVDARHPDVPVLLLDKTAAVHQRHRPGQLPPPLLVIPQAAAAAAAPITVVKLLQAGRARVGGH